MFNENLTFFTADLTNCYRLAQIYLGKKERRI